MENPQQYTQNIPDEIILKICTSLPAKSIGRFRCVSKPWNSLLSEPQFIKTHLNRIKHRPNEEQHHSLILEAEHFPSLFLIHLVLDEMPTTFATELTLKDQPFKVGPGLYCMASCDGLILVLDWKNMLVLLNPTTREIREVPPAPYALDHPRRKNAYGLGYDSSTDDYKVVRLFTYEYESDDDEPYCPNMFIDVFSVKNGTWKRVENSLYYHTVHHGSSGVFLDGYIHWLAFRTSDISSVILAFDLAEEKFHEVQAPSVVYNGFVALGGCLCMFPAGHCGFSCETDVWVMKEYGVKESWTKYTIFNTNNYTFMPICMLGKEVVLMKELIDVKLVVCNLEDGKFKDIVIQGIPDEFRVLGNCLESLVSPYYTN